MGYRKHRVDFHFFDNIDSEAKAYILGFLYADGCNFEEGFQVYLKPDDIEILWFIKQEMSATHDIIMRDGKYPASGLAIWSLQLSAALSKQGCTPRKTRTLRFPSAEQVPSHLLRHFIRGYFDGDGTVYTVIHKPNPNRRICLEFIGTEDFLLELEKVLRLNCDLPTKKLTRATNTSAVKRLCYGGSRVCDRIQDWLYQDCTFWLNRKRDRFINFYTHGQLRTAA